MLAIRLVTDNDCHLLWQWVNDPEVRLSSFQTDFISWKDHQKWFRTKKSNPNCCMYLLSNEKNVPVGQVRFDLTSDKSAFIDISIAKLYRGYGYGTEGLKLSCQKLFKEKETVLNIIATVKTNNTPSLKIFQKVGFQKDGKNLIKGQEAIIMKFSCYHAIKNLPIC